MLFIELNGVEKLMGANLSHFRRSKFSNAQHKQIEKSLQLHHWQRARRLAHKKEKRFKVTWYTTYFYYLFFQKVQKKNLFTICNSFHLTSQRSGHCYWSGVGSRQVARVRLFQSAKSRCKRTANILRRQFILQTWTCTLN